MKEIDIVLPEELASAIELFSTLQNENSEKFWRFAEAKAIEYISSGSLIPHSLSKVIHVFGKHNQGSESFWTLVANSVQEKKAVNKEVIATLFADFKDSERTKNEKLWKVLQNASLETIVDFDIKEIIGTAVGLDKLNATGTQLFQNILQIVEQNTNGLPIEYLRVMVNINGERGIGSLKFWKSVYARLGEFPKEDAEKVKSFCEKKKVVLGQ